MHTTDSLLNAVREKLCLPSDYALAQHWQCTRQRISEYRRGSTAFSDSRAIEIADLLGLDPAEVLLSIQAERAAKMSHSRLADVLRQAVFRLSSAAPLVSATSAASRPATSARASTRPSFTNNTNYAPLAALQALRRLTLRFLTLALHPVAARPAFG